MYFLWLIRFTLREVGHKNKQHGMKLDATLHEWFNTEKFNIIFVHLLEIQETYFYPFSNWWQQGRQAGNACQGCLVDWFIGLISGILVFKHGECVWVCSAAAEW